MNKFFTLFLAGMLMPALISAQSFSTGPQSASVFTQNTSVGSQPWSGLPNLGSSDNQYTGVGFTLGILASANTHYAVATGFGFSIPSTAVITGVEVSYESHCQGLLIGGTIRDNQVRLVKANAIAGTNRASGSTWPGTDTWSYRGGSSDLWGTTLTPAEVNSPGFGVAISAYLSAGVASIFLGADIDQIRINIFYIIPSTLPVELTRFEADAPDGGAVHLEWETASELNNSHFLLQRSSDGVAWEDLKSLNGAGNSNDAIVYMHTDLRPLPGTSYYRLNQFDFDGTQHYSEIVAVQRDAVSDLMIAYDALLHQAIVNTGTAEAIIRVVNLSGQVIYQRSGHDVITIPMSGYAAGIYSVTAHTPGERTSLKIALQ